MSCFFTNRCRQYIVTKRAKNVLHKENILISFEDFIENKILLPSAGGAQVF